MNREKKCFKGYERCLVSVLLSRTTANVLVTKLYERQLYFYLVLELAVDLVYNNALNGIFYSVLFPSLLPQHKKNSSMKDQKFMYTQGSLTLQMCACPFVDRGRNCLPPCVISGHETLV